jgi:hypothetical protein
MLDDRPHLDCLALQAGVAGRAQLLGSGVTASQIRRQLTTGRWQLLAPGVYATFSGPVPPICWMWAAQLRAGPGAVAGPRSTLWLVGATDRPPTAFDVLVPWNRRVRNVEPFVVRRRRDLDAVAHPSACPARMRIEDAVLDLAADQTGAEGVIAVVLRVVQRRLTTSARLRRRLAGRRAHRWRALLEDLLIDTARGVQSPLERRWVHDVEQAHGLPTAAVNRADDDGRRRYRDAEYLPWGLVCELDGREAHPDDARFRDRRRDNQVTVSGRRTLRYGWREVVTDPCGVAAEVASVLRDLGWTGTPHPCGPDCRLTS